MAWESPVGYYYLIKMNKYFDVIIATPGLSLDNHYVMSLIETINYLNKNNISYKWINDFSSHVGEARQRVVDQLLNFTYNKVIWIDSDIDWSIDEFISIYNSSYPIVGGCYLSTNNNIAAQDLNGFSMVSDDLDGTIKEVFSCGFGFLAVEYGIFENIKNPFAQIDDALNEDIAFCARVKNEMNLPLMLDTSIRLAHFKVMPLIP